MIQFYIKKFEELSSIELYQILQLRSEVFVVEQNCVYQDIDSRDLDSFHVMAKFNNEIMGYSRLLPKGISYEAYCSIGRVLIQKNHRIRNYGKKLMQKSIEYCQLHFDAPIKISAQLYLEKFYRSLGFTSVSAPYLEDDIPHIAMKYDG